MIHGGESERQFNIDFSVNLNPMKTPDEVIEGARLGLEKTDVYPEYSYQSLSGELSRLENVDGAEVLPANGASELIMAVVRAIHPKHAILVEPGFYGYRHALNSLQDCQIEEYFLDEKSDFKLDDSLVNIITKDSNIIFLTNPWNPCGFNIDESLLEKILIKANDCNCYVVLDESFLLLSEKINYMNTPGFVVDITTRWSLINTYSNLFIIRSFTKLMAIPGIRTGYLLSCSKNIELVKKQLCEWNISQVADYTSRACVKVIEESNYVEESNAYIKREREFLMDALRKRNIKVYDSDTVFILIRSELNLYSELLNRKILIRDCAEFVGLGSGYYRIAVKDHEANIKLIEAIDEIRAC